MKPLKLVEPAPWFTASDERQDNILLGTPYDKERYKKGDILSAVGAVLSSEFPVSHLPVWFGT
jgi:hypothetical protein